ncbi:hypothetical protein ACLBVD_35290, partial [Pseudomonas aeruginosa]
MPAETPPLRPDADPPQCALPEARPDRDAGTKLRAAVLGANDAARHAGRAGRCRRAAR